MHQRRNAISSNAMRPLRGLANALCASIRSVWNPMLAILRLMKHGIQGAARHATVSNNCGVLMVQTWHVEGYRDGYAVWRSFAGYRTRERPVSAHY